MACSGLQINSAHELKASFYRQPLKESTEESNRSWDAFSCSEEEEKKTQGSVVGQKRDEKTPYTVDSQSCQIQVTRIETPSGHLCPPPSFHRTVEKTEGRGGHRWPYGLSVWCLGRMSGTERGRAGCVRVKGKGVEKRVMCSFPFCSAWWLQALDIQTSPSRTLLWHWKVCENSSHGRMWERRKQS